MSSDSELEVDINEFWQESLESEPPEIESPQIKTEAEFYKSLTIQNKLPSKFLFRSLTLTNKPPLPHTQESIDTLRKENKVIENLIRQEVKTKTRQELKAAVEEINAEFEKEIHVIRLEHDQMKAEIAKKTREIALLSKFMIAQEIIIAQNRLVMLITKETQATPAQTAELLELKRELNIIRVQIEGLKEAATDYSNQTFAAQAKLKELDAEIEGIKSKHNDELKAIEIQMLKKVEEAKVEREKVRKAFENYKNSGWQSIEDTEGSVIHKNKVIEQLKSELKTAKEILRQPKIKLRVHEKLEDYVKEYEEDEEMETVTSNVKEKSKTSKFPNIKTRYHKANNLDFGTRFTSFCSDTNTAYSKLHTRRSTVTDGFRTRLSPI